MFATTITPCVSETDGAGHVNNTVAPVTYVHFDYATQRARPVPAQARTRLLEHRRAP
jgi:acyl-CoA thioesterase FadM